MVRKQSPKNKIRAEIIKTITVPPKRKGDTGYLKLTDEEIDKIVELFRETLQRFIEETIEEVYKEEKNPDILVRVFYENINQKQAKWLEENL